MVPQLKATEKRKLVITARVPKQNGVLVKQWCGVLAFCVCKVMMIILLYWRIYTIIIVVVVVVIFFLISETYVLL
jgi:hypothetical protein